MGALSEIDELLKELFPLNRSLAGEENRKTLRIIKKQIPISILEYKSGTKVFDWTVPREWKIKEAWIKDKKGNKIVNLKNNNLHVPSYSNKVNKTLKGTELTKKLYFNKSIPNSIPYRTIYYKNDWGFCLSYTDFLSKIKRNEKYHVFIDSEFKDGSMSLGELVIKGKSEQEVLISSYICHPSLANDSLSGVVLSIILAKYLYQKKNQLKRSYRFLFLPETIGPIAYISKNIKILKNVLCGLVITTVGGPGKFSYKKSFEKNYFLNNLISSSLDKFSSDYITYDFDIYGSDERQYSSPGVRINTASIFKDRYYDYEFYHTSFDDLKFVNANNILKSLEIYLYVLNKLDTTITFKTKFGGGEPKLGKYGLYNKLGGAFNPSRPEYESDLHVIKWLLFYCDGKTPLSEIAVKSQIKEKDILSMSLKLKKQKLIDIYGL